MKEEEEKKYPGQYFPDFLENQANRFSYSTAFASAQDSGLRLF